jgi:alkaline phosphatase D
MQYFNAIFLRMKEKMLTALTIFILSACYGFCQQKRFTIAFGSCNRENRPQPLWEEIEKDKPNLWIWLGDNIYGDTDDTAVLRSKYNLQLHHPGYKKFTDKTPLIGTWDDHDYGRNDGNKTLAIRKESQQIALDFLKEPANSARRTQEGIYAAYEYKAGNKVIKVILLDVRYHQDPLKRDSLGYIPDPAADILGEAQWQWLDKQLRHSKADVHIIGSGLQFIPEQHRTEKWGNFPSSLNRFYKLLVQHKVKAPLLITGDRHIGEFSKITIPGLKQPLYEFTASGLTHSTTNSKSVNRYRFGSLVTQLHYGLFRFTNEGKQLLLEASLKGVEGITYTSERIIINP